MCCVTRSWKILSHVHLVPGPRLRATYVGGNHCTLFCMLEVMAKSWVTFCPMARDSRNLLPAQLVAVLQCNRSTGDETGNLGFLSASQAVQTSALLRSLFAFVPCARLHPQELFIKGVRTEGGGGGADEGCVICGRGGSRIGIQLGRILS